MSSSVNQITNIQNYKIIITHEQNGSGSADYSPEKAMKFMKNYGKK
jgi:hypothetical protein